MDITLVIMTKSRKNRGLCVAGPDISTGKWIRLVADYEDDDALSQTDLMCEDNWPADLLDVVTVPVLRKVPGRVQQENLLIDRGKVWRRRGSISLADAVRHFPPREQEDIFGSVSGNRAIAAGDFQPPGYSLQWIEVEDLVLAPNEWGKTMAAFWYAGVRWRQMSVTDSRFERDTTSAQVVKRAWLALSISEHPWQMPDGEAKYYIFVAGIHLPEYEQIKTRIFTTPKVL